MDCIGLILHLLVIGEMFATVFRVGPLVLLEVGLVIAILVITQFIGLPACYSYTLGYLALIVFLLQMIFSVKMVKNHRVLRQQYICQRAVEPALKYYCRLVWDYINIVAVIAVLYYSQVIDGVRLAGWQASQITGRDATDQCQYTLFSLCIFDQLQQSLDKDGADDKMVMWLLYVANAFITSTVCFLVLREFIKYTSKLKINRQLKAQYGTINQTLLDSKIFSVSTNASINEQLRDQIGECSICLMQVLDNNESVVRLRCGHMFHKTCIGEWLRVKKSCPMRCPGEME